jgi:hypothetical protein
MTTSLISLGAVNVEAAEPGGLGKFWAGVTGGTMVTSGGTAFLPAAGPGGFAMFFHPSAGPRPRSNPMHLDLTVPWGSRASEVVRLESLGATRQWDVLDEEPHVRWTTMTDPEGNLFCVAEHPPATP